MVTAFDHLDVMPASAAIQTHLQSIGPASAATSISARLLSLGAVTAVVERGYIDVDYSASYYLQRGRAFSPSERATIRLHFFGAPVSIRSLKRPTIRSVGRLQRSYLGSVVVRPGTPTTIGRTFLPPPDSIAGFPAFFPTREQRVSYLAGTPLAIENCPYVSQDQRVMACATAALWMSSTPLASKLRGIPEFSTAEITSLALNLLRPYTPTLGGRGLSIEEMDHAFVSMGYDPKAYQYPDPEHFIREAHIAIDSGIPPVVAVYLPPQARFPEGGMHAQTLVGFTRATSPQRTYRILPRVYGADEYIHRFVIHDDQCGMYQEAAVTDLSPQEKKKYGARFRTKIELDVEGQPVTGLCVALFVPFPTRVMAPGSLVMGGAAALFDFWRGNKWLQNSDLVLRVFLARSNQLKQQLLGRNDVRPDVRAACRALPMPRYVWFAEAGYLGQWNAANGGPLPLAASVIFDSTSTDSVDRTILAVELPTALVGQHVDGHSSAWFQSNLSDPMQATAFGYPMRP